MLAGSARKPGGEWYDRLRLPVIVAPMFLLSGPEIIVAAAKAGVVGAFPTLNARTIGDLEKWLKDITERIVALKATGVCDGTWAANIIAHSSNRRLEQDLELLCEYKPPIVITALGSPERIVERVHAYGGMVIADVNSIAFARKAADTGVDGLLLVASGAGGHTGQLNPFAFVETVRMFWNGLLVLAGSISTGRALKAALMLGADMASLGTRFIATPESMAHPEYKRMVIEANFEDILCTNAFTGAWANMLRPSIIRAGLDPDNLKPAGRMDVTDDPHASNRAWRDIWSAGHGVGLVRHEQPVAAIVAELEQEFAMAS
ncbi:MAG: nitronate monooxygenase [Zoogloeaceae bacterium]|nr:nitronate monooxygenase [Zoogloeaceae bacterium]